MFLNAVLDLFQKQLCLKILDEKKVSKSFKTQHLKKKIFFLIKCTKLICTLQFLHNQRDVENFLLGFL